MSSRSAGRSWSTTTSTRASGTSRPTFSEDGDPVDALARWYMDRNVTVPCATRVQNDVDWDAYLLQLARRRAAQPA